MFNKKNKIEKITLYMGLNDKDTKVQKFTKIESFKLIQNILRIKGIDATISESTGLYHHDDGTLVIEESLRIEILFFESKKENKTRILDLIQTLKVAFNQESVAMQVEKINSQLVWGGVNVKKIFEKYGKESESTIDGLRI